MNFYIKQRRVSFVESAGHTDTHTPRVGRFEWIHDGGVWRRGDPHVCTNTAHPSHNWNVAEAITPSAHDLFHVHAPIALRLREEDAQDLLRSRGVEFQVLARVL